MQIVIEGARIKTVRRMTDAETRREYWDEPGLALVLDTGTILYASRDNEGNGPGALFGMTQDGRSFQV